MLLRGKIGIRKLPRGSSASGSNGDEYDKSHLENRNGMMCLREYRSKIDLQCVMSNFHDPAVTGENVYEFRGNIDNDFPNAKLLKCHTSQAIHLGSIDIDILMTRCGRITRMRISRTVS